MTRIRDVSIGILQSVMQKVRYGNVAECRAFEIYTGRDDRSRHRLHIRFDFEERNKSDSDPNPYGSALNGNPYIDRNYRKRLGPA